MILTSNTATLSIFFISLILGLASFAALIYFAIAFSRNKHVVNIDYKSLGLKFVIPLASAVIFSLVMFISIVYLNDYPFNARDWSLLIIGGILFVLAVCVFFASFIIYYYKTNLERGIQKILYPLMITSIIMTFVCFIPLFDSYAPYMPFPLSKGILINGEGISFPNYLDHESPTIAWYALFILGGAILVYFICDHKMYKEYGKHGLLESTFLVALPSGIIGARIWFVVIDVIGNPDSQFRQDWTNIFKIWDGGLAIVGGAVLGIIVGVLWFMWRNKGYSIFRVMDIVVPTILIAQAVGRWGNFFNYEVYGGETAISNWWFLPTFIIRQMDVGWAQGGIETGTTMFVPLFLIESVTNLIGYFVIAYIFGKALKKYMVPGNLAAMYIIWYGITRAIMEPLRDAQFEYDTSWITAFVMIGVGLALIGANYLIRYYLKRKKTQALAEKNYKLIIFDLDGTSADTDKMVVETMRQMFQKFAPEMKVSDAQLVKFSGPPLRVSLPKTFPDVNVEEAMNEFNTLSKPNYYRYVKTFPGEKKTLLALKKAGYKLAIVTNKANKFIDYTMKLIDLEGVFDVIVGFDDVKNPKPDPEGIKICQNKLGLTSDETLYIGDTYYDYLTAKNAKVDFALVKFANKPIEEKMEIPPKFIFVNYEEILHALIEISEG